MAVLLVGTSVSLVMLWAPLFKTEPRQMATLMEAITKAGDTTGKRVVILFDIAASVATGGNNHLSNTSTAFIIPAATAQHLDEKNRGIPRKGGLNRAIGAARRRDRFIVQMTISIPQNRLIWSSQTSRASGVAPLTRSQRNPNLSIPE